MLTQVPEFSLLPKALVIHEVVEQISDSLTAEARGDAPQLGAVWLE